MQKRSLRPQTLTRSARQIAIYSKSLIRIPIWQGPKRSILVSDSYKCEHTGGKPFRPMCTRGLNLGTHAGVLSEMFFFNSSV